MIIKKTKGTITAVKDLSKTAKEVTLLLDEPINFIPGSFVNIFMNIEGEKIRRAYSISSSDTDQNTITLSIRLSPHGKMTPLFWNKNLIGETIELMGPLGLNTVDKMIASKIYLFGFGIGAGVIKSITEYFYNKETLEELYIVTGSRTEDEILYKDFFDTASLTNPKIKTDYIVSNPQKGSSFKKGYIQEHIDGLDFNNSEVYVCGQELACNALVEKIQTTHPVHCNFLIEGFH